MSTSLHTVLQHVATQRDKASAACRRSEENLQRLRQQADSLAGYRADYQQRWQARFQQQAAMEIIECYRTFMERLDEAMAQQQRQLDHASAIGARLNSERVALEQRVRSVEMLIARRAVEQQHMQDRRDQRQTDEAAAQAYRRRLGAAL